MNLDIILFAVLPYVAIAIELVASIWRYFTNAYKFSSLSSEFLENRQLFWGSVPWHYGIMFVLLGHLVAFLFPKEILLWNSHSVRLVILEVTALIFGLLALVGLVMLIYRRFTNLRIQAVTTRMDIVVLLILLVQVVSGLGIATTLRWGSSWYAAALVPYLRSLFSLQPEVSYIASMHWLVQVHVINAFVFVAILPFTRLVHFLILPISYLWRSCQVVIWYQDPKKKYNSQRRV